MTGAGILIAPAAIGWAAQLAGLVWTLNALVPLLGFVAVAARTAGPAEAVRSSGDRDAQAVAT